MNVLLLTRDPIDDKLPAYAWPGGYPIVYYTPTGEMLCPDCATEELDTWCDGDWNAGHKVSGYYDGPQWSDILYEGIEWCTGCNEAVRGAYEEDTDDE